MTNGAVSTSQSHSVGHGRCADMQELAVSATANGDKAYFTYGSDPNNANTWDANRSERTEIEIEREREID